MVIYCPNTLTARVNYTYRSSSIPNANGFIISNNPGALVTTIQPNNLTVDCGIHSFSIIIPQLTWSLPGKQGISSYVDPGYASDMHFGIFNVSNITVIETADLTSYYGVTQKMFLRSRGRFRGFEKCGAVGNYALTDRTGGGRIPGSGTSMAKNAFYPLFDTPNILIQGVQGATTATNNPTPCRFRIIDQSGLIYDRTEILCPEISLICSGTCAPGQTRIGTCCLDCEDLSTDFEAIRQAMRRI